MRKRDYRTAAAIVRALLDRMDAGGLTVAPQVRARLEGVAVAFEAAGRRRPRRR